MDGPWDVNVPEGPVKLVSSPACGSTLASRLECSLANTVMVGTVAMCGPS